MLPTPGFHHLHLNSMDPDAAMDFYLKQFPTSTRTQWEGFPAVKARTNVLILFTKVETPPATAPQTAIWHFGWHVTDTRACLETYQQRPDVTLLPLYTGDADGEVFISSDTWPGTGGVLGLTQAQIADAKAGGVQPVRSGGFGYMQGPDKAIVEYAGNRPVERFNHVHLYQEDPFCAQLWYQQHLNAPIFEGRTCSWPLTEATCMVPRGPERTWPALEREGMFRTPAAAVEFDDVAFLWYMQQGDQPLVSSRGHVSDHIALSVTDLDAWVAKLRSEGVRFLEEPYALGHTRAVMIEGPSREALELVEVPESASR
ncbi:MAG: VOC family protein [Candidatus Tectomicrobia bacterium]|uniref:VOC family protein n=1 Tax=Tectimicrobiota bacterium TaxID=2528274 RepID=A0A938B3T3_UNCTE|nr:VOC family protein [Candidatus Tectomicrobia bacterium]